jgi:hypothetical protein
VKKKATLALEVALLSFSEYPRSRVKLRRTAMSIMEIARPKDPHIIGYMDISLCLPSWFWIMVTYTSAPHSVEEERRDQRAEEEHCLYETAFLLISFSSFVLDTHIENIPMRRDRLCVRPTLRSRAVGTKYLSLYQ